MVGLDSTRERSPELTSLGLPFTDASLSPTIRAVIQVLPLRLIMGVCLSCFKRADGVKGSDLGSLIGDRTSSESSTEKRKKFKIIRKEKLKWNGSQGSGSSVANESDRGNVDETRLVALVITLLICSKLDLLEHIYDSILSTSATIDLHCIIYLSSNCFSFYTSLIYAFSLSAFSSLLIKEKTFAERHSESFRSGSQAQSWNSSAISSVSSATPSRVTTVDERRRWSSAANVASSSSSKVNVASWPVEPTKVL